MTYLRTLGQVFSIGNIGVGAENHAASIGYTSLGNFRNMGELMNIFKEAVIKNYNAQHSNIMRRNTRSTSKETDT